MEEIAYPWPFYKSLLFHLLVWSINNSQIGLLIKIDIELIEREDCLMSEPAALLSGNGMSRPMLGDENQ